MDEIREEMKNVIMTNINLIKPNATAPHDAYKKVFACPNCKTECTRASSLTRHIEKCIFVKKNIIIDDNKLAEANESERTLQKAVKNECYSKSLQCKYCKLKYAKPNNLTNHMKKCPLRENLENDKKKLTKENKKLEENNKCLTATVKKSIGTFKFIQTNYQNAPNLIKI